MAIVIDAPKLLPIRITTLTPKDVKNDYVYTFDAVIDVTAQLHSGTSGFVAKQYDGRDVNEGDYIATTSQGRILKILNIINKGPTRIQCVLMDEDQMNASVDPTQFGESSIDKDDGILFAMREGKPFLFPLPDVLPGGLTNEFATQILSRFNYVSKEKNINVELQPHTFEIGETVLLTANGWVSATTNPTGVIVSKDDDSFGVRLFGDKTAVQLPGDVGDVYYWDDVDRMLTKTPTSQNAVKLFQKIDGKEALLLGNPKGLSGGGGSGNFDGAFTSLTNLPTTLAGYGITDAVISPADYGQLINKPTIPTDLSQLTDTTNLLSSGGNFDGDYNNLTNKPTLFSGSYNDLTDKPNIFSGNYNDLYNKPTIPQDLGDFTNNAGYLTAITSGQVVSALGFTPQNSATAFGGSYTDLTNKPTIPADVSELTDTQNLLGGGGGGGGATSLGGLTDVSNATPQTGYVLKWNGTQWAPAIDSTTGIGGSSYATEAYVDQKLIERGDHFSGDYNDLVNRPVLFSGSYNDLLHKPASNGDLSLQLVGQELQLLNIEPDPDTVISTVDLSVLGDALAQNIDYTQLDNLPNLFSGDYNDLVNRPVLFSGDYNDLSNKPYIPSIAGLATTNYVDTKTDFSVPSNFLTDVEFRDQVKQKLSTVDTTGERISTVMAIQTTDDVETEVLFPDNTRIEIADGTTAMVEMHIVGSSSIGQFGVKLQGIVHRAGSNVFLIGGVARETLAEYSTWTADLDVNPTSLKVTVTGSAATTVDWTVFTTIFSVIR